jgi:hypothetical protein
MARGLVGRRVGDVPHCARCDYELPGFDAGVEAFDRRRVSEEPVEVCSECGTRLVDPSRVYTGRQVRRPKSFAAGAVLLVLAATVFAVSQLPVVANFRWIEYKPEKWLLHDAVEKHEQQISWWANGGSKTSFSYGNRDLVELFRRAEAGTLGDGVLVEAARVGTGFIKAWATGETNFPFDASSSFGGSNTWGRIGGIALDRKLLTREERAAFCTATLRVQVRPPERVVGGDPLPIQFLADGWGPDWDTLADQAWPSAWGAGGMDFTLTSATVDGEPIDLVQFDDDGRLKQMKRRRQRLDVRPWTAAADEHPRANYPVGRHKLRVELTARVRYEERLHAGAEGSYPSLAALGFPDEGWSVVAESEFEVVENGPAREIVPLRGALGLEAKLVATGDGSWNLRLQVPLGHLRQRVRDRGIFAARLSVRAGDEAFDLGSWVSLENYDFIFLPELTQEQILAILDAPADSAFVVVTPDADIARLVTAPGALIATDPIELPIEIEGRKGQEP